MNSILERRWTVRGDFTDAEFARARAFYEQMRFHDERLEKVRAMAAELITKWTGHTPRDVGSFGTRLNLETSDLDLGIGYPVEDRDRLRAALAPHTTFLGERKTRFSTSRLVFSFTVDGIEIDLSALTVEDFAVACRMLDRIDQTMTLEERIAHTWVKHLLRSSGRTEQYAAWKLVTYARFCPEFDWVPIPEKTGT
ncbi:hypothetical protein [Streptantibioticus parmotrematis]|uniref:hypothetical protein n=1 Tax=Streptantibioticus parmotrematis TaxID=2873249 RepID=UPI00207BD98D|nr:hypothetical protein [Streptantibioticus parmotrematis]